MSKNIEETFTFVEIDGYSYQMGNRKVVPDIFGSTIYMAYASRKVENTDNNVVESHVKCEGYRLRTLITDSNKSIATQIHDNDSTVD